MSTRPLVLVVEHEATCPPALFGTWLEAAGCTLEVCRPYAGDALPARLSSYDAVLVLGGSMSAHDDHRVRWLAPLKALIRDAVEAGVPTLGICLGHQLVALALGGDVVRNPRGQQTGLLELGWTPAAARDPLLGVVHEPAGSPQRGVQWNNDLVTSLPPGAELLAATPVGEIQAVRFAPTVWGVQLHPEADVAVVSAWAEGDRADHLERGVDTDALLAEIGQAEDELESTWQPLAGRLADLARSRAGGPR
ncbi:type 1 glutamine amidotransferase [Nocardioides pacificus]